MHVLILMKILLICVLCYKFFVYDFVYDRMPPSDFDD
jgi:hypothetical protein